ncbi:MAG TPA: hypothetical protein VK595_02105 [Vicinamibacterales bacterium]|jgi:hypothetical protein|nr:hypothetical protein [Vicinamibacterales bacterium]
MTHLVRLALCGALLAAFASPMAAGIENQRLHGQNSCAVKAQGVYGFQCHGSAFNGNVFEPVTFVGTVEGSSRGFYEGFGTFNSSNGSFSTHVAGQAKYGPNCFGHVDYTTNEILLPNGEVIRLEPISFDFAVVDDGHEILGTAVAPPGVTGDLVPRLTCRLVKLER